MDEQMSEKLRVSESKKAGWRDWLGSPDLFHPTITSCPLSIGQWLVGEQRAGCGLCKPVLALGGGSSLWELKCPSKVWVLLCPVGALECRDGFEPTPVHPAVGQGGWGRCWWISSLLIYTSTLQHSQASVYPPISRQASSD